MKSGLQKVTAFVVTVAMLFAFASCGKNDSTTDSTTKEPKTYVITTEEHTGEDRLYDEIFWHDSSICAVAYLGDRSYWEMGRDILLKESFSDAADEVFADIDIIDAGGNDVYLFIPRFNRGNISAYTTLVDSKGKVNANELLFYGNAPFYLICDSKNGTSNVKVEVLIPDVMRRSIIPSRDMVDGTVISADGFQDITPSGLHFDRPHTTAPKEMPTE